MSKIVILTGSKRKGGNTELLRAHLQTVRGSTMRWRLFRLLIIRSIRVLAVIRVL